MIYMQTKKNKILMTLLLVFVFDLQMILHLIFYFVIPRSMKEDVHRAWWMYTDSPENCSASPPFHNIHNTSETAQTNTATRRAKLNHVVE